MSRNRGPCVCLWLSKSSKGKVLSSEEVNSNLPGMRGASTPRTLEGLSAVPPHVCNSKRTPRTSVLPLRPLRTSQAYTPTQKPQDFSLGRGKKKAQIPGSSSQSPQIPISLHPPTPTLDSKSSSTPQITQHQKLSYTPTPERYRAHWEL